MKCMKEGAKRCAKYRAAKDKAGYMKCLSNKPESVSKPPATTPKPTTKPTAAPTKAPKPTPGALKTRSSCNKYKAAKDKAGYMKCMAKVMEKPAPGAQPCAE